jgi:hypothetical protein
MAVNKIVELYTPTGDTKDGGWLLFTNEWHPSAKNPQLLAFQPTTDESDPAYGEEFEIYNIGDVPDFDDLDWADWSGVASFIGQDEDELIKMAKSSDPKKRVWAVAAIADYTGWGELSGGYLEYESDEKMNEEFGPDFDAPEVSRGDIERILDDMANWEAAMSLSDRPDEGLDLDREEWDEDSPVITVAEFGDHIGIDGEEGASNYWQTLPKQGYEITELGGDWPGSEEVSIDIDHVASRLAEEEGMSEARAKSFIKEEFKGNVSKHGEIYWGSSSGEITVYAKPAKD